MRIPKDGNAMQGRSFSLCSICFAKEKRPVHRHPYEEFYRLDQAPAQVSGTADGNTAEEGFVTSKKLVPRPVVQQILEANYKVKNGFWGGAVDCLVQ